jgi:hypothetical protein
VGRVLNSPFWLLSARAVAYQQLGSPDPASLEIPSSLIYDADVYTRGNNDFPRFLNVATPLKVDAPSLAGGSVTDDVNNDGLIDIVTSGDGMYDQIRVFLNSGAGAFTDFTAESGLLGMVGGINLCHTDYNNDGNVDVMVLRGGWKFGSLIAPNSLLRCAVQSFPNSVQQLLAPFPAREEKCGQAGHRVRVSLAQGERRWHI